MTFDIILPPTGKSNLTAYSLALLPVLISEITYNSEILNYCLKEIFRTLSRQYTVGPLLDPYIILFLLDELSYLGVDL